MTTRRARQQKLATKPPMPLTLQERARRLPMFGPGIVITIPLSLLPAYLKMYQLEPRGVSSTGTLLVKRVPQPKEVKNV